MAPRQKQPKVRLLGWNTSMEKVDTKVGTGDFHIKEAHRAVGPYYRMGQTSARKTDEVASLILYRLQV